MKCILTEVKMDVRKLASLKSGDIIPIDKPGLIKTMIENIALMRGSYGQSNGRVALKVERFMQVNPLVLAVNNTPAPQLSDECSEAPVNLPVEADKSISNF